MKQAQNGESKMQGMNILCQVTQFINLLLGELPELASRQQIKQCALIDKNPSLSVTYQHDIIVLISWETEFCGMQLQVRLCLVIKNVIKET